MLLRNAFTGNAHCRLSLSYGIRIKYGPCLPYEGWHEMTRKEFINSVAKRKTDIIQPLLDILAETGSRYCLIWGLAVNAYVEPVVSLDLDIVVTVQDVEATAKEARNRGFAVEQIKHSVKLSGGFFDSLIW
jgi:hypothetical protein